MASEFDSRGGSYDQQTQVTFNKQLFREQFARTIIGSLAKPGPHVAGKTSFASPAIDSSTFIWQQSFAGMPGDEKRITLSEAFNGMGVHGDLHTRSGEFLEFMSQAYRINTVKSPGFQVHGAENRKRVAASIMNMPGEVRTGANNWMAQEDMYDFLIALYYGADKTALNSLATGGLAVNLGPGSGIGAGTPLCGMHQYTTDEGFITYDGSALSTHNSLVNDAINGIDAAAADKITLAQLQKIREKLDDLHFLPGTLNGQQYKALAPCDPQIARRIAYILKDDYKNGMERGKSNPIFNCDYQIEFEGVLYVSVPDMKKFRPSYNAANSRIDIGPNLTSDPRTYSNTSTNASIFYLGAGAVLMAHDGQATAHIANAQYGPQDGMGISLHKRRTMMRNQWETKDGRTESKCYNVLAAHFYEPGIDW